MVPPVRISSAVLDTLLAHARREGALECCGLLAGRDGVISTALPARNALASETSFEIAPAELFEMFRLMRARGLEHMGIYHSHPVGENAPSSRDIGKAYYPGVAYFIISPTPGASNAVRAFAIQEDAAEELPIEVVSA